MSKQSNIQQKILPSSIFKAYDIRGRYPEEIDEEGAYRIGASFATLMQTERLSGAGLQLAVGRDMRLSSPALCNAVMQSIQDMGSSVIDFGLVSTPTFYFGVSFFHYDGGIMISASHNPKEYNGCKLVRAHAASFSNQTGILEIRDMAQRGVFARGGEKGRKISKGDVLKYELDEFFTMAEVKRIHPLKIVADPACAMGALDLEALFARLPCSLVKMNFTLDGSFPAHEPDPLKEANLVDLKARVEMEHADLGIATDGDGDRIFFVDNEGEVVPPHILRGLLAQIFLRERPGATICYDVRPGRVTHEMILAAGGVPCMTRVGHSFIKEKMQEVGAYFAGESSGHYFLNLPIGRFEVPLLVVLKVIEELSQKEISLADWVRPYRKYVHSGEINIAVSEKQETIEALAKKYVDARIHWLDGASIEYDDWWCNVRASNTENILRLNLEAVTKERMEEKRDEVLSFIKEQG